jgi:CBS domain-containing protein
MSTNLITVMKTTPVTEALVLFEQHRIHHLPVVAADRTLLGIVSQTDITKLVMKSEAEINALTVGDIMVKGLAKLDQIDTVATAANLFMLNRFHALPVVEGDKIVGMLTTLDLIKLIDKEEVELEDYKTR